jgi:hypothetical protein
MKTREAFQISLGGFAAQFVCEQRHCRVGQQRRRMGRGGNGAGAKRDAKNA